MPKSATLPVKKEQEFPAFDLERLLTTVFHPKAGEKIAILIDLEDPRTIVDLPFLKDKRLTVQRKAYEVFYQALHNGLIEKLGLAGCDFFAYKVTGGSNLELPEEAFSLEGKKVNLKEIYSHYQIILCITTYSATAPLTATAKKYGFRGATMHGMNDLILKTGLAIDYNQVSQETEKLRLGMTKADSVEIVFEVDDQLYHLKIDLGKQEAQKSHGLCRTGPDVANLPAGEVYFVPKSAEGQFPIKFDDGTIGLAEVHKGAIAKMTLLKGNADLIKEYQARLDSDPATGILGELGFGTMRYPYAASDIQDEKIFGTFHLATGRNDHLKGNVTLDKFKKKHNASHDDILYSSTKTPEIGIREVVMQRNGQEILLIANYEAADYLWKLLK